MERFDFLTKECVKTFSYTTATKNRYCCSETIINGRKYMKYGHLQAVTVVGNLFEDKDKNQCLCIGVSKQHPNDSKCNKNIGYEEAYLRSLNTPDIIFYTVPRYLTQFNFEKMVEWYIDGMDLQYVKTKEEKINSQHIA